MTFFESLLLLLAIAIGLLPISRRFSIPYPTMLSGAGVVLALLPDAPRIELDPRTALPLFIAPALCDAATAFPATTVWRLWRPLVAYAVFTVILSTVVVASLGVYLVGLPLFAAMALGAIVAPPDAAAATAVLRTVRIPRNTVALLEGESLFNDATSLLLFTAALAFQNTGGVLDGRVASQLGLAAPGGLLLGFALAHLLLYLLRFFAGVLSAYLLEYLFCFGAWIAAEHLGLSAVLCVVAFAMTFARFARLETPARIRLDNAAVSRMSVFLLNALAFLLMGFQARSIVSGMAPDRLREAAWFATAVVACLILIRMLWVLIYNRLAHEFHFVRGDFKPGTLRHVVLVGWCGMRGLVTLATAFVLPSNFPQRDLIVLTAFAVVLVTLVVQGMTLAPLVRLLGLDGEDGIDGELASVRGEMAATALTLLKARAGPVADHWRFVFDSIRSSTVSGGDGVRLAQRRRFGLDAIQAERECLQRLLLEKRVGPEVFAIAQEDLDFSEMALTSECARRIEES